MPLLTFKVSDNIYNRLKYMASQKSTTMTEIVTELLNREYAEFKGEYLIPCANCRTASTIRELEKSNRRCPKCGKTVRMLRAPE